MKSSLFITLAVFVFVAVSPVIDLGSLLGGPIWPITP